MTRTRVDVGVVTWNTAELTVTALRHLLDTDQGVEIRLFVRDNSSSDGTPDAIARGVPEADVEVGPNVGFGAGMNTLIAKSDAPWFFALNPDAWPEPGAIGHMATAGAHFPRAAAMAPKLLRPDGVLEHSTHPFPSTRSAAVVGLGLQRLLRRSTLEAMALEGFWLHDRPRAVDWAVGAALLMRRSALDEIGGFDERFFMYAEDLEWCWRAHKHGWEIRFEPDAVVRHVRNASGSQAFSGQRLGRHYHNTYRFYRDEHGSTATTVLRGLNIVGALRESLKARLQGNERQAAWWLGQARIHRHIEHFADRPNDSGAGTPSGDRAERGGRRESPSQEPLEP